MVVITPNSQVTLHFSLALNTDEIVESTFDHDPATFTMGDGSLLPGFERCLLGLVPGDNKQFTVTASEAFGHGDPRNIMEFNAHTFAALAPLTIGMVVSFADQANNERPGVITALHADRVTVDFNHPLAGRSLIFTVEIIDVSHGE